MIYSIYLDEWTVFGLLKNHAQALRLMFEICHHLQISLNLKKCLFATPHGIFLGHIICKEGLMVDPMKVVILLNITPPQNVKEVKRFLGYISYYCKFIKYYVILVNPIEELIKINTPYIGDWNVKKI